MFQPLIRKISDLYGWKRNAFAFSLGIMATLTLAPFFIFPLLIPAFTGLYLLIETAPNGKRAFLDGWWWGWGYYITGLYWFCIALLTDAEHFAWLIPFALFGLTGVIAIYCGLACWITFLVRARGVSKIIIFSSIWMCVEYARGHLFTGFPWNLAGYSFGFSDWSMQLASLVGIYGLTWFAVVLGSSFAALTEKRGVLFIAMVWTVFVFGMGWGAWRLHQADQIPESERYVPGVMLRLVQANISQPHKWDPELQRQGVIEHIRLTRSPGLDKITHIVWPETAVPYAIEKGAPLVHELGAGIPEGKILITGALRIDPVSRVSGCTGSDDPAQSRCDSQDFGFKIWNSLVALDHDGNIVGTYDKSQLVPFGEFLPFRSLIPKKWLTPVGETDFSRGGGTQTLVWPGLPPIYPLICYEVIFPDIVIDADQRPQLLLNVTNDAWFGMSSGPYQHFEMSRMRAVEQGIPLVRAANTGISAVVDSYGRVLARLPLGTQGILDHKLPKAQNLYTTYSRYGKIIILSLLFLTVLLMLNLILKQGKRLKN